jgi:hypothetical protein
MALPVLISSFIGVVRMSYQICEAECELKKNGRGIASINTGRDFILLKKLADRLSALLFSPCASGPFATPFRNYTRLDADFAPSNRYLPWPARLCYI